MSILEQLSSQSGDHTEGSNIDVARQCLENPMLLEDIAEGLERRDADLVGDCAEVMTKVAEERPDLVAPYAEQLAPLLEHRKTRVRWEAMHAIALLAPVTPEIIRQYFDEIVTLLREDESTIARDYAVEAMGNYAQTGATEAEAAYPILLEALDLWEGKHAARALNGLVWVAAAAPDLQDDIMPVAQAFADHGRPSIQKAAKALLRALD